MKVVDKRGRNNDAPVIDIAPIRKEQKKLPFTWRERLRVLRGAPMIFETVYKGTMVEKVRVYLEGSEDGR
jgi:hypothetical protein